MKQNSYVKISDALHPNTSSVTRFQSIVNIPDEEDYSIVDEIIKINKNIGSKDPGGAWKYYNENTRKEYVDALNINDREVLAKLFSNLFQNCCSSAIITPSINVASSSNLASQMLWDLDALAEFSDLQYDDSILHTPKVGSPFGIKYKNFEILPDSARHLHFAQKLIELNSTSNGNILEIGGGYGGLIYFLKKMGFKDTYFNIDLPETLYVCYYYLKKNKIKCEFLTENITIKEDTVYLIPSIIYKNVISNINFDVFFNSASLSEMALPVAEDYIEMVNLKRPEYILHCNSNYLAFPDSVIHIEILARNFPIDNTIYRKIYQQISPFQGASGRYRQFLYQLK